MTPIATFFSAFTEGQLPPSLLLGIIAILIAILPATARRFAFFVAPILVLFSLWLMPDAMVEGGRHYTYGPYTIIPYEPTALGRLFATAFSIVLLTGGLFSWYKKDADEQIATLLYAAGAIGVVLAGDYLSLFIFWELMALSSTWLVWTARTEQAKSAGMRYLLYHVLGGGLFLAGIVLHVTQSGSLTIQALTQPDNWFDPANAGTVLIFLGAAVNAAIPPLHTWVPDAYSRASVTGAVFMSALTTKSAIFVLIILFPGWSVLITLGVVMALYGTLFGLLSDDFRQVLAYSIIAQLGYMTTAIGIGSELALNGAAAHAFSHILYKSLLFMTGGAVLHSVGTSRLSALGGLINPYAFKDPAQARDQRRIFAFYMVGALSISGLPLLNGFISKPMIIEAVGEAHVEWAMLALIAASIGTFLHTGLKIPYLTWFRQSDGADDRFLATPGKPLYQTRPLATGMLPAMAIGALLCVVFGVFPWLLYAMLPYPAAALAYHPFDAYPIAESLLTLSGGFVAFHLLKSRLVRPGELADLDQLFRALSKPLRLVFVEGTWAVFEAVERLVGRITQGVVSVLRNPLRWLQPFQKPGAPTHDAVSFTPAIEVIMALVLLTFVVITTFIFL